MRIERLLSPPRLQDFAERCRRLAAWERDPHFRSLLLSRAEEYERQAKAAESTVH